MSDRVFSFEEMPDSREETTRPPSFTLRYKAVGEQDDLVVQGIALAYTPGSVVRQTGRLYRQDIRKTPDGWAQYIIEVPYAPRDRETGSISFSFDTTGATVSVKAAKEHIQSYPADGDFHKGAIGVKGDGEVEGIEVVIPALKLNYSIRHPEGVITEAYARQMASVTGCVNSDVFRGFQPGELLFIGGSGSDGSEADAEVSYQFIASQNATGLTIGEIVDIAKKGHEALWIEFQDEVEDGQACRQPKNVHIERVYDPVNFVTALGWGP